VKADTDDEGQSILDEDEDPRAEIARLETCIEELSEALERCRKIKLFSQLAIAGGAIWMAGATLGILGFDPVGMIAAIAAVIGGIVGFGSNTTTTKEAAGAMKAAEARRAELISALQLRVVGGADNLPRYLH
jgi:hypothetical protein